MKASDLINDSVCADCAGFDIEWMYSCKKHGTKFCRGCECPECGDDKYLDPYEAEYDNPGLEEDARYEQYKDSDLGWAEFEERKMK